MSVIERAFLPINITSLPCKLFQNNEFFLEIFYFKINIK